MGIVMPAGDTGPRVVGVNRTQDGSLCVMDGSRVVCCIQKERLSRRKHHWGKLGDLRDFYRNAVADLATRPIDALVECFSSDREIERLDRYDDELRATLTLAPNAKRARISHHLSHLYSLFPPSPFDEAAVMIVDGQGSPASQCDERWPGRERTPGHWREVSSIYRVDRSGRLECLDKQLWSGDEDEPVGLGMFYFLLTQAMFPGEGNEGKVMGLAPHGDPQAFGLPPLDVNGFDVTIPRAWREIVAVRPRFRYDPNDRSRFDDVANLAAAGQRAFEDALLKLSTTLYERTGLDDPPGARVSWRRPGGGIGGLTFGAVDHYDQRSPRQTFAHWDAGFIAWLRAHGHEPEYCTDLDLHEDDGLLVQHRLLLSVGHDEYWSEPMRAQVERFVAGGGNACFLGANVCWWRIHLVDDCGAMVCHQGGPRGALDHWWSPVGAARPEDSLTGVSYRHGGGWWDGPRETRGFVVQDGAHWVFDGTGLRTGDAFGANTTPPAVGYECDGAPLLAVDAARGRYALAPDAARCGTPRSFRALAVGPLDERWQELPHREGYDAGQGVHSATLGLYERGGTVFTAGSVDWAQALADGSEPAIERITRNVIERLAGVGGGAGGGSGAPPWSAPSRHR